MERNTREMSTKDHRRNETYDWAVLLPLALPPDLPPVILKFGKRNLKLDDLLLLVDVGGRCERKFGIWRVDG